MKTTVLIQALLWIGCLAACTPLDLDTPATFVAMTPGPIDVSLRPTLEVIFDQPLLPESVHRDTVALCSGSTRFALSVEPDPTLPGLRARRLGGSQLDADIEYELRVDGVRSLDGVLSEPLELRFRTGEDSLQDEVGSASWLDAKSVFDAHCVLCHQASDVLDLSTPEGVRRTAIGVPASGREFRSPERGLSGLEIVSLLGGVGRPGFSYLLYTLLDDPHLLGGAMPPSARLSPEEIRVLRDWIRSGAPTE
ncbi:MAG: hypothetical protein ACI9KE_004405 [Polyangiales bacterium]|jgi:hypothetical protein